MKKPYSFKELSDVRCQDCGRRLKMNVVARKERRNAKHCYKCGRERWLASQRKGA